jgi:hypothetical protein
VGADAGTALGLPPSLKINDAERIPAGRYYEERFYRLEAERLWPRCGKWRAGSRKSRK